MPISQAPGISGSTHLDHAQGLERFPAILDTLAALGPMGLARFEASLDPTWIEEGLEFTGKASIRRRKLPAEQVVWLVLGMALFRNRSIVSVVEHLDLVAPGVESLAPSAIPAARRRLGAAPMEWLFRKVAAACADAPQLDKYRGLDLYGIDGSHLRVQDSDENFEHFGKPGGRGGNGDAGYPQLRLAVLMNLRSRLLTDVRYGPYSTAEQTLADAMVPSIPDNSITILICRDFWVVSAWGAPGRVPRFLAELRTTLRTLIIPPRRSDRRYPRHVKIKMSNYKRNRGRRSAPGSKPPA